MNRDETIALFKQGRKVWNAWADRMLEERAALQKKNEWAEKDSADSLFGLNEATSDWIERASIDFTFCVFVEPEQNNESKIEDKLQRVKSIGSTTEPMLVQSKADFRGLRFPANANFRDSIFTDTANFEGAYFLGSTRFPRSQFCSELTFIDAVFSRVSIFADSEFYNRVDFWEAAFLGNAWFQNVAFSKSSRFYAAKFFGRAYFEDTVFRGPAVFSAATFSAAARFHRAHFFNLALFNDTEFSDSAEMSRSVFEESANFIGATFKNNADFRSINSKVGFHMSKAHFEGVPDFTQAILHRDPRLDDVNVERGSIIGPAWHDVRNRDDVWKLIGVFSLPKKIDRDAPAKFRELKRFAIQGEDHRSELRFHAHEIRTSRFVNDWPSHPRFWFGVGYELLSNFGRSIIRPLLGWAALVTVFAAVYLGISAEMSGRAPDYASLTPIARAQHCHSAPADAPTNIRTAQGQIAAATSASAEAWSLALKNGFVFIDWDRSEAARRTYGCLFGLTSDGGNTYPVVPRAVSIAGLVQNVFSAVLIFLLLLGIRNLLKLK